MKKNKREKTVREKRVVKGDSARGEQRFRHLLPAVFLACATFLAYLAALKGTWALDDTAISKFASIGYALNVRLGYRKIAGLSFLVNRWIDPVSPVNYRVTNILIHICNALLVYAIAWKTMRLPAWKEKYGEYGFSIALLSATIFALHPININAVSYIVQRMTSLSTMFVLLSLLSYIGARTSSGGFGAFAMYGAAPLFVICGIFSKENAVLAIPLIALYEVVFLFGGQKKRHFVRMAAGLALGLLILAGASVFLHFDKAFLDIGAILLHPQRRIPDLGWTATDVHWTPVEHVLTEFRVIGRYLFLIFFPLPRFFVFDWWSFPISTGILSPFTTLISLGVIVSLISFVLIKFRKLPFLSFGIIWYFVALTLESFIALGSDLYFEHRNYLPLAGLAFGATAQAVVTFRGRPPGRKTVLTLACAVALLLGGLTYQRNLVWRDSITLWKDTLNKTQGNLRAMIAMGNSYIKASDLMSAKKYYQEAAEIGLSGKFAGYFEDSIYSLGMVDFFMGKLEEAKKVIEIMDNKLEGSYRSNILKGVYSSLSGDPDEAIKRYETILPSASGMDRMIVFNLMGDAFLRKGSPEKAIENYRNAIQLDPSFSAAYYGMATTYLSMKDLKNASYFIEKTLALDPYNVLALSDMADVMLIKKEPPEKARDLAAQAVAKSPVFYQPYLTMGNVLIVMGREDDAEEYYRKAKERGMQDYMIPFSKARAYFMKGDKGKAKIYLEEVLSSEDAPAALKKSISGNLSKK